MLKGHTKIILTDVETGAQEVHEDDNLVTNAIDKIINLEMAMNHAPNEQILPLAANLLGGIMLFDGDLTEDPTNIHFPVEAHLVGYGNQDVHTGDKFRGSYNAGESGKTGTGFVSVWDFGTNQANGTIKSVARTSNIAGRCPFYDYLSADVNSAKSGNPTTDTYWQPIRYDGEHLYMLKGNSDTHQMRLARVKIPCLRMGVADYSGEERTYEVIATWDTLLTAYDYWGDWDHTQTRTQNVYADSPSYYEDGHDGYIYCVSFHPLDQGYGTIYDYNVSYFTIKYSDDSYDKSETVRIAAGTVPRGRESASDYGMYWAARTAGHVCKGRLFMLNNRASKQITIIPLNNPASFQSVRIIEDASPDYIVSLDTLCGHEGAIYFSIYHYTTSSYEILKGLLYPDGNFLTANIAYGGRNVPHDNTLAYVSYSFTCDDDIVVWGPGGDTYVYRNWMANFLGTINNLSSAITKTAAQTMKIIYTMTDVNE